MKLAYVKIENFRSIKSARLDFSRPCRALIGINESGKTNVLHALALLNADRTIDVNDLRQTAGDETPITEAEVWFTFNLEAADHDGIVEEVKASLLGSVNDAMFHNSDETLGSYVRSIRQSLYRADLVERKQFASYFSLPKTKKVRDGWVVPKPGATVAAVVNEKGESVNLSSYKILHKSQLPDELHQHCIPLTIDLLNSLLGKAIIAWTDSHLPTCVFWSYSEAQLLPASIEVQKFRSSPSSYEPLKQMFLLAGHDEVDSARRACKVDATKELLPRMTGYLQAGEQRIPAISISRSNDGSSFRLTKHADTNRSGSQAFFETSLILAVGGEEMQRVSLPGGEALPESPWIFTADEVHQLIGVGSAKPRDESVWIALPPNCDVQQSDGAELVELDVSIAGRKVVKLSGEVRISFDEVQYRVSTKSNANRDCLFELRGKSKRLGTGGSQVWCGPPTVWQIPLNEDEVPSEVSRDQLQWKPVTGGSWSGNFGMCLGHVQIRVVQDGDTRYLARAIVMPSKIELQVVPGSDQGTGALRILGLGKCRIAVERDDRITTTAARKDGAVVLDVSVVGTRPGLIRVRISFENGNSCDVSIVCPTTSFSILNVMGQPVDYPNGIPTDNLDGLTVQVIQPEQRIPLIYWPEGSLLIDRLRETNVPGVFEFPLSYIASYATELLACSDDPDGKVKFGIGTNVAFAPRFHLSVGRYSHALDRTRPLAQVNGDEETTEICVKGLAATTSTETVDCNLNIVPLGSPNDQMPTETITSTGPGSWLVNHSNYPSGYYLVIASDTRGNSYRPLRFVVKASALKTTEDSAVNPRPAFWTVMNTYDKPARLKAWDNYFKDVATSPAHPDWAQLDDFVNSSETLPITTFEAVAAITRNHFAAARYGILFPHRERLWRRFEQLPFLWSAIPIHAWLATAMRCWAFAEARMVENDIEPEQVRMLLAQARDRFVKEAPNRSSHMASVVFAMFASDRFGIQFTESLHQLLGRFTLEVRTREHTRLISHHDRFDTRSTWPNFRIECDQAERDILRATNLMIEDGFRNQWAVLNGPGIAAVKAVYGEGLQAEEVVEYKRLRALDPDWYDIANAVAMSVLLDRRCKSETNYLVELMESLST
jgi:AAA ATPase domain